MRWLAGVILLVAIFTAEAFLGTRSGHSLQDSTGAPAAGLLAARWDVMTIAAVAMNAGAGLLIALILRARGMPVRAALAAGVWLLGFASATGGVHERIARGSPVGTVLLEAIVWSAVTLGLGVVLTSSRAARRPADEATGGPLITTIGLIVSAATLLPVVWLLARSEMKGQTVTSAVIGSTVVGLVGSFALSPRRTVLLYALPPLIGGLAFAFAWWQHDGISPGDIGFGWTPFAQIMPQDYAAGAMAGVALGLSWSRAFLVHDETPRLHATSDA